MTVSRSVLGGSIAASALLAGLAAGQSAAPWSRTGLLAPTAGAPAAAPTALLDAATGPSGGCSSGPSGFSGGDSGGSGPSGSSGLARSPAVTRLETRIDPDLVDVDTVLGYEQAAAAGTGIVIGSKGEVLTNNHVIREATSVKVTDLGNHKTYTATVAGYDLSADVAVLRLHSASGLQTAPIGNSSKLAKGTAVVALGNACGVGGTPSVAIGRVVALHQSITASDSLLGSERLKGMIETSARLQPGDSGGPLVDETSGKVVGMDTAGATGFSLQSSSAAGFAVPISTAASIARQIEKGKSSGTVHVGPTAFLGVAVEDVQYVGPGGGSTTGVAVVSVVAGGPAAKAGLTGGDVLIAVGGRTVSSPAAITDELLADKPGSTIKLRWMDPDGSIHQATAKLISGPPQ